MGVSRGAGGAGGACGGATDCREGALCAAKMVKPRTAQACRVPFEAVILCACDDAVVGVPERQPGSKTATHKASGSTMVR